jgi:hypothetical protein
MGLAQNYHNLTVTITSSPRPNTRDDGAMKAAGAEAEQDVRGVEEVQQGADHGERERQRVVELDAHVALRARQVQEQRVHEQRQQAGGQEDLVPQVDQLPARVEEEVAAGVHQLGLQLLPEGARKHPVLQGRLPARLLQAQAAAAAETRPAFPRIVSFAVLSAEVLQRACCSQVLNLDLILKPETSQRTMTIHFHYTSTNKLKACGTFNFSLAVSVIKRQ